MRLRVLLAFAAIFIVWGSTYLAIRYAVAEIPPLLTAGVRHLTAGCVLYGWARVKGYRALGREWGHSAVVGLLFFLVGHGTLHWAEQSVPSGLAALLVATEPLWIALLLAALGISRLGVRTLVGALLGLAGVWALVGADVTSGSALSVGAVAILIGAASWGAGVVYAQRAAMPQNPTLRTATTLLCGAPSCWLRRSWPASTPRWPLRRGWLWVRWPISSCSVRLWRSPPTIGCSIATPPRWCPRTHT
jgi:drug/metabolite transporter (DMT)-like permease